MIGNISNGKLEGVGRYFSEAMHLGEHNEGTSLDVLECIISEFENDHIHGKSLYINENQRKMHYIKDSP